LRIPVDSASGKSSLWKYASSLLPKKSSTAYNSALLDLGALVCLPRKPKCKICPIKKFCRAKNPQSLPIKQPRPETKQLVERHAFVASRDKLLLAQSVHRWRGMWILPPVNLRSKRNGAIYRATFPFTNHLISLQIFRGRKPKIDNSPKRWFPFRQLDSIPIPSPHRRAIDALLGLNVSSVHAQR
jgi:A/G-specific adenine glycosylase